jgi:hypothetical protein
MRYSGKELISYLSFIFRSYIISIVQYDSKILLQLKRLDCVRKEPVSTKQQTPFVPWLWQLPCLS